MEKNNTIVIIGGGLKKDGDNWRTTNYDEGDNFGIQGDRLRVVAGSYLYKNDLSITFIASAGKGQYKDITDVPTVAEVIKQELTELGVPADKIIKEEESGNTYQQLQELKKIIKDRKLENIIIISNEYHLPRLKAIAELDDLLKDRLEKGTIEFMSAEEILIRQNPEEWQEVIETAYNSQAMEDRIALEGKGVRDIKEGRYKLG